MNMMIHLFKKDVLRLQTCLIWWAIPLVLVLLHLCLNTLPGNSFLRVEWSGSAVGLSSLMLLLMIPILIQEDSLVSASAFWLTRPVSRRQLLGAKGLFLFLLILGMTLGKGLELVSERMEGGEILSGAGFFALETAALVIYLALVSALTSSFRRYVLYAILGPLVCMALAAVAGFAMQIFLAMAKIASIGTALDFSGLQILNGSKTQDLVVLPVIILAGCALLGFQYFTRKTRATRFLALAVLPMIVVVQAGYFFVRSVF